LIKLSEAEGHVGVDERLLNVLVGGPRVRTTQQGHPTIGLRVAVARGPSVRVGELQDNARASADVLSQRVDVDESHRLELRRAEEGQSVRGALAVRK
jgi:hypothetical protein